MATRIYIEVTLSTDSMLSKLRNSSLLSYKISDLFAKDVGWDFMDEASWEMVSETVRL